MLNVEMRKNTASMLMTLMLIAVLASSPVYAYIWVDTPQPTGNEPVKPGLSGCVFYDSNANGVRDAGETVLSGIQVELWIGEDRVAYTTTGSSYCFYDVWGEYTVKVVLPQNWASTTPSAIAVTVEWGETSGNNNFGIVRIGYYGGGHTPGFWSSKNGEDKINDGPSGAVEELDLLAGYNLRTKDGEWFEPKSYSELRTWLLDADATNMAYMLSVKLAAMVLNFEAGFVDGGSLVYAPGVKDGTDFLTISELMSIASYQLGLYEYTPQGDPNRAYQEILMKALDAANNNLNFVYPAP
jgi:hypothetical protein